MLVYQDLISGDELLSDSFQYNELFNGVLREVEGKWVVVGAVDVNIGANPSAEGGEEDESVDDQAVKVVDIVDTFRLQEQPPFDKKQFVAYIKKYIKLLTPKLEGENQEVFKKNIEGATKFLLSKLADLQFLLGRACMMTAPWCLHTTRKVLPTQHFCTLDMVSRKSSAETMVSLRASSSEELVFSF